MYVGFLVIIIIFFALAGILFLTGASETKKEKGTGRLYRKFIYVAEVLLTISTCLSIWVIIAYNRPLRISSVESFRLVSFTDEKGRMSQLYDGTINATGKWNVIFPEDSMVVRANYFHNYLGIIFPANSVDKVIKKDGVLLSE